MTANKYLSCTPSQPAPYPTPFLLPLRSSTGLTSNYFYAASQRLHASPYLTAQSAQVHCMTRILLTKLSLWLKGNGNPVIKPEQLNSSVLSMSFWWFY